VAPLRKQQPDGAWLLYRVIPQLKAEYFPTTVAWNDKLSDAEKFEVRVLRLRHVPRQAYAEKPAACRFMTEQVVPAWAAALGIPASDPMAGCSGCDFGPGGRPRFRGTPLVRCLWRRVRRSSK
jgi:hypothetical protein